MGGTNDLIHRFETRSVALEGWWSIRWRSAMIPKAISSFFHELA